MSQTNSSQEKSIESDKFMISQFKQNPRLNQNYVKHNKNKLYRINNVYNQENKPRLHLSQEHTRTANQTNDTFTRINRLL